MWPFFYLINRGDFPIFPPPDNSSRGGIAQLGERLHGMQEVGGSIPLTSTNFLLFINLIGC
jgi:hypothetical protein